MSTPPPPPVHRAILDAMSVLAAGGVETPRYDASELLAWVLGVPRGRLATLDTITPDQYDRFARLITERARRVPLQHLVGAAPFRYLELAVGLGVFVPRPETELLVDWGLAAVSGNPAPVVVDLCSGSGAIAVSVAREHPGARVYAVEQSPDALAWLRRNAQDITVVEGDATDPGTLHTLDGHVDLVLCNPPYVPAGTAVAPEVEADPATAVFGGADGLEVIRKIIVRAGRLLRPLGSFGMEHDETQGAVVAELLRASRKYSEIQTNDDLAGRPRFVTARRLAD